MSALRFPSENTELSDLRRAPSSKRGDRDKDGSDDDVNNDSDFLNASCEVPSFITVILLVSKNVFALYQGSSLHSSQSWGSEEGVEFRAQSFPEKHSGFSRG